ncbi:MAG: helix-turn-helix domain-containing protein [Gemmataceae bacterium]
MFGEKMTELRKAAELSEAKLAETAGVAFGTIREYVMGRRAPSYDNVRKIAKVLGVSVAAFENCTFPHQTQKQPKKRSKR